MGYNLRVNDFGSLKKNSKITLKTNLERNDKREKINRWLRNQNLIKWNWNAEIRRILVKYFWIDDTWCSRKNKKAFIKKDREINYLRKWKIKVVRSLYPKRFWRFGLKWLVLELGLI